MDEGRPSLQPSGRAHQMGVDTREDLSERIAGSQGEANAPYGHPDLRSILSNFSRIVWHCAWAISVPFSPSRRRPCIN